MYAYIKGKLTQKTPAYVVIEAGGVGYHVNISLYTYSALDKKDEAKLYIQHYQREDLQALYGFIDEKERSLFNLLLSVSGVGPNTTRIILSSLTPSAIEQAVLGNDVLAFKQVKGVGPKTAQRIIIDLKDKIGKVAGISDTMSAMKDNTLADEALSALVALGFSRQKVSGVVHNIISSDENESAVEEIIKKALKMLA